MTKRAIDIEQLLTWAFVEELPKRDLSSAEANWENISEYGNNGGVGFDIGNSLQRYGSVGAPHPDAVIIEHKYKGAAAMLGQSDGTHVAIDYLASRSMLFGEFDRQSIPATISLPTFNLIAIIKTMAVLRQRPRWNVGRIRVGRTLGSNGRPKVIGITPTSKRYTPGAYCPLTWSPSLEQIGEARAEYLLWHQALTVLADALADSLVAHAPTRPAAPQTPWLVMASTASGRQPQLLVTPAVIAAIHEARKRGRRRAV